MMFPWTQTYAIENVGKGIRELASSCNTCSALVLHKDYEEHQKKHEIEDITSPCQYCAALVLNVHMPIHENWHSSLDEQYQKGE